jgi:hypothetical protein
MTGVRMNAVRIFAAAAMVSAIALVDVYLSQYEVSGPELLTDIGFKTALDGWSRAGPDASISVKDGVVELRNGDPSQSVSLQRRIELPVDLQAISVAAWMASQGVRKGPRSWNTARLFAVPFDDQGKPIWRSPHLVAAVEGDTDWVFHEAMIVIPDDARGVDLGIQMSRAVGVLSIHGLSLRPATARPDFETAYWVLLAAFAGVSIWLGAGVIASISSGAWRIVMMVTAIILIAGIVMPGSAKGLFLDRTFDDVVDLSLGMIAGDRLPILWLPRWLLDAPLEKVGHFLGFAAIAGTAYMAWAASGPVRVFLYLIIFSAMTEAAQFFVHGRAPSVGDWLIDGAGIVLATVLYLASRGWTRATG